MSCKSIKKRLSIIFSLVIAPVVIFIMLFVIFGLSHVKEPAGFLEDPDGLEKFRKGIPLLDLSRSDNSDWIQSYFDYYGFNFENARHYFGYFDSSGRKLAAHVIVPDSPSGTVYLVHGYLNHCALNAPAVDFLLEEGYAVVTFDLPGHGLSDGERADIDDFNEYAVALGDLMNFCRGHVPEPYIAMGHSTGSAAVIEFIYTNPNPFSVTILSGPLLRSKLWNLSRLGVGIFSGIMDGVSRRYGGSSSDKEYMRFVKEQDPLQSRMVPFNWAQSLYRWNERVEQYGTNETPIIVLQGLTDTVVDEKYNIPFLQQKFPNMHLHYFEGARHNLYHESPAIREDVFDVISGYLE